MSKFEIGDLLRIKPTEEIIDEISFTYRGFKDELISAIEDEDLFKLVKFNTMEENPKYTLEVSPIKYPTIFINVSCDEVDKYIDDNKKDSGEYEEKGRKLGSLVDQKQLAYGNAVAQTYEVVKAFMTPYFDEETKTYTIPQSLLQHLLLQVRLVDKQNRIFNNPDADLMNESPYQDMAGYSLLGANMQDKMK